MIARFLGSICTVSGPFGPQSINAQTATPACPEIHDDIYYDPLGLIVQKDYDGGDTAQREGMYWFGSWLWQNDLNLGHFGAQRRLQYAPVMDLLEDGKTGRSAATQHKKDHNLTQNTSRDQLIPLIAAMGVHHDYTRLDRLRDRIHQGFYFVNKDWMRRRDLRETGSSHDARSTAYASTRVPRSSVMSS